MSRVLVVDDEPDVLLTAVLALRLAGHDVLEAGGGVAALERIERDLPDAVVLDLRMADMDGWEVLDHVRSNGPSRDLPIIVLSAHATTSAEREALARGADLYMTKPFDPRALVVEVERVLGAA